LIENLIVMWIVRVGRQNLVVELDRLARTSRIGSGACGKFEVKRFVREWIDALAREPFFEVSIGFPVDLGKCG